MLPQPIRRLEDGCSYVLGQSNLMRNNSRNQKIKRARISDENDVAIEPQRSLLLTARLPFARFAPDDEQAFTHAWSQQRIG